MNHLLAIAVLLSVLFSPISSQGYPRGPYKLYGQVESATSAEGLVAEVTWHVENTKTGERVVYGHVQGLPGFRYAIHYEFDGDPKDFVLEARHNMYDKGGRLVQQSDLCSFRPVPGRAVCPLETK